MSLRPSLRLIALDDVPEVEAGDDLAAILIDAIGRGPIEHGDILVVAQKIASKAEGRRIALAGVAPSSAPLAIAGTGRKDPRLVELVPGEADAVVRVAPGVLIVRHRLGFLVANAGIDQSNVTAGDAHALLLPRDPDGSARAPRLAGGGVRGEDRLGHQRQFRPAMTVRHLRRGDRLHGAEAGGGPARPPIFAREGAAADLLRPPPAQNLFT